MGRTALAAAKKSARRSYSVTNLWAASSSRAITGGYSAIAAGLQLVELGIGTVPGHKLAVGADFGHSAP